MLRDNICGLVVRVDEADDIMSGESICDLQTYRTEFGEYWFLLKRRLTSVPC